MTITPIHLPDDFGNDGPRDAAIVRSFLEYRDGKMFWRKRVSAHVMPGRAASGTNSCGYSKVKISGRTYAVHRLVWLVSTGEWPAGEIDHINGVRNDNRIENLRAVSGSQNSRNRKRPASNGSGATGVSWYKRHKKWMASIGIDGKIKCLGYFCAIEDAIKARKTAEREHSFHPNHDRVA